MRSGGKVLLVTEDQHDGVKFGTVEQQKPWYANRKIQIEVLNRRTRKLEIKDVSKLDIWLASQRRRECERVVFEPGGGRPDEYNLWKGFAVEHDPSASCELFLEHLLDVVCGGDEKHFRWVLGFFAQMVQEPGIKPGVALVLLGGRGTGKTVVGEYVGRLFRPGNYVTIAHPGQLTGQFNNHMREAIFIQVEEAVWAGSRAHEGVLKNMVTSSVRMVEPKGVDPFPIRDCARMFMTSNEAWAVPSGPDERRWAVLRVSGARAQDTTYFAALHAEMNGRGPAALMHLLLNFDLSTVDLRQAPKTAALLEQKQESLPAVGVWWLECLRRGSVGYGELWPDRVETGLLYDRFKASPPAKEKFAKVASPEHFGRELRAMMPSLDDERPYQPPGQLRPRFYLFPALDVARAEFDKFIQQKIEW